MSRILFTLAFFLFGVVLLGLFVPYLAYDGAPALPVIGHMLVMQCKEQANTTAPDTECRAAPTTCAEKQIQKTFFLSVGANGAIISGSAGIQYTITVNVGCLNQGAFGRAECLSQQGIQWTDAGGPVVAGDQNTCPQFGDNCPCIPNPQPQVVTVTLPPTVLQQLVGANGTTFSFTETDCIGFPCQQNTCPGLNGGQTWFYTARQKLCN